MHLPESVLQCVNTLENAGYETWAVGGCVRDWLLGIEPHDFDLCTAATPAEMQAVFSDRRLVLAGVKHGTVGVVTDSGVVEITTFRTEGDYADARHPGWVRFVPRVEEDLARRDFTINAMAWSPSRGLRDPFGGREDLENHVLRAVGDPVRRFREDALRILRGLRFAPRFDLKIEENTWNAMLSQVSGLDSLAKERVFDELCNLLPVVDWQDLLTFAPIITRVIPELAPAVGFDQHSPHHAYDVYTHIAHVVGNVPPQLELRFAALLHDGAKPACFTMDDIGRGHFLGHAERGGELADRVLRNLKAPTALREEVVWLVRHHMMRTLTDPKAVRRALSRHGLERMEKLLIFQRADLLSKDAEDVSDELARLDALTALVREVYAAEGRMDQKRLAVNGNDLLALGYPAAPILGQTLDRLLELVLGQEVPNDREILLETAKKWIEQ